MAQGRQRRTASAVKRVVGACCQRARVGSHGRDGDPLVAFRPRPPVQPRDDRVRPFVPILGSLGLVLEPVEVDRNYKINRRDTNDYVARILPDALKLPCERIIALGPETFERIVTCYLTLPRAPVIP